MQLQITVDSTLGDDDLRSLCRLLQDDRELGPDVELVDTKPGEEALGSVAEYILVSMTSGGGFAAISAVVNAWLGSRPSAKVKMNSGPTSIEIDNAKRKDIQELMQLFHDEVDRDSK